MNGDQPGSPSLPVVRFYKPSAVLLDLVTSFYVVETDHALVDHLHPEWGNIRLLMAGGWRSNLVGREEDPACAAALFGPTDRTRRIAVDAGQLIGIGLTPLGWLKLIGTSAAALANRMIDLGERLGPSGDTLNTTLSALPVEADRIAHLSAILELRAGARAKDEAVDRAIHRELIAEDYNSAARFAIAVGVSERALHRVCLRAFGFPPKRLLRRQRFLRALDSLAGQEDQPLSQMLGSEFYDQSHFNREFRNYMGMTPSAYFKSPREALRQAAIARQRQIGASLQGLHPPGARE